MVLWISKMQFWQQWRKNFAKTQIIFCSKSGNVSKKLLYFGNFLSSQNKLLSTYVEGSVDNRAESSPSKARIFLIKFQKWQKASKNFKYYFLLKVFVCTRRRQFWENSANIFEVKFFTFTAHTSERFEI